LDIHPGDVKGKGATQRKKKTPLTCPTVNIGAPWKVRFLGKTKGSTQEGGTATLFPFNAGRTALIKKKFCIGQTGGTKHGISYQGEKNKQTKKEKKKKKKKKKKKQRKKKKKKKE